MSNSIFDAFLPLGIGVLFLLWFGFYQYFKQQGLTFRQGIHRMFHGGESARAANVGGAHKTAR
jgi:hypothetical protein